MTVAATAQRARHYANLAGLIAGLGAGIAVAMMIVSDIAQLTPSKPVPHSPPQTAIITLMPATPATPDHSPSMAPTARAASPAPRTAPATAAPLRSVSIAPPATELPSASTQIALPADLLASESPAPVWVASPLVLSQPVAAAVSGTGRDRRGDHEPLATNTVPAVLVAAQRLSQPDTIGLYPRSARRQRVSGESQLELTIDTTGRVTDVRVLSSSPPGVFDSAAVRAATQMRYLPATRDGQAIVSRHQEIIIWSAP